MRFLGIVSSGHCGVGGSGQDGVANIGTDGRQENNGGVAELLVILLLMNSLLLVALIVLPLEVIMDIMASAEVFTNIVDRLINFFIGVARIDLCWARSMIPWLTGVDGVVAIWAPLDVLATTLEAI